MADGYLEKRYEEVFGKGAKKTVVKHTSLETIMEKNRSYRGYDQNFVVKRDMLERIVAVNAKIASAKNQQVLRFKLVTKETGADIILQNMKLGGLLPELHLPYAGTEPEAFIIICSTIPESKFVDIDLGIAAQSMLHVAESHRNGLEWHYDRRVQQGETHRGVPVAPRAAFDVGHWQGERENQVAARRCRRKISVLP